MAGAPVTSSRPASERFDSWKEIARYLGRDLRTVRRWEQEKGLPVHRVPGGERQAVFAYRAEIDAWLSGRLSAIDAPSEGDQLKPPLSDGNGPIQPETQGLSTARSLPQAEGNTPPPHQSKTGLAGDPGPVEMTATRQRLSARLSIAVVAGAIVVLAAALTVLSVWLHRESRVSGAGRGDLAATGELPPQIDSVSAILPQRDQRIVIRGRGFGMHTPYKIASIPFIAIRDNTGDWAAGRMIPQNWDEVTLNVESWQDTEIVVSGFSGLYGSKGWKLTAGDDIEVAVWNPQSSRGPALYHMKVTASPAR